jgi:hypothetical protein
LKINDGQWFDVEMNTSYPVLNLTEGLNIFYLRSFDALLNNATDILEIMIDHSAPEVQILSPENGTITSQQMIVVDWGGADIITGISGYMVKVDDGQWIDAGNESRMNISLISDGPHTIVVRATDLAGNYMDDKIEVILDTTSPDIFFTFPNQGYSTTETSIRFSWVGYDSLSGLDGFTISLDNGIPIELPTLTTEYTFSELEIGDHIVYLKAMDVAGNPVEIELSFVILEEDVEPDMTTIRGLVTDEDGEPLHDVEVTSENGDTTKTDSTGKFSLEVERGDIILTFKKKGYREIDVLVQADQFDTNDTMSINMEKKKEDKDPGLFDRTFCLVCCGLAIGVPLFLIFLGLLRRSRTKKRKRLEKEMKLRRDFEKVKEVLEE